jgi:hypothetical protein
MEPIYVFIVRNDVWIYILSALGLFWFGSEFLRARRMLKRAVFGLEKERGQRIRNNALSLILLFSVIIGAVYYVNASIAPTLPPSLFRPPTPTPNIFVTPLSSPTPLRTQEIVPPSPTPPLVPTITLPGQLNGGAPATDGRDATPDGLETPLATDTPGPTVTPFIACTIDLNISEPSDGGFVSGAFSFSGTADFADFLSYRIEANGPETNGQWASLLGRTVDRPVREGFLGNVNLSQWSSGPYLIRLVGTNTSGSDVGFCVIQVTIDNR